MHTCTEALLTAFAAEPSHPLFISLSPFLLLSSTLLICSPLFVSSNAALQRLRVLTDVERLNSAELRLSKNHLQNICAADKVKLSKRGSPRRRQVNGRRGRPGMRLLLRIARGTACRCASNVCRRGPGRPGIGRLGRRPRQHHLPCSCLQVRISKRLASGTLHVARSRPEPHDGMLGDADQNPTTGCWEMQTHELLQGTPHTSLWPRLEFGEGVPVLFWPSLLT